MIKRLLKKLDSDLDELAEALNRLFEENKTLKEFDSKLTFHLVSMTCFVEAICKWCLYFGSRNISYHIYDNKREVEFVIPKIFPEDL